LGSPLRADLKFGIEDEKQHRAWNLKKKKELGKTAAWVEDAREECSTLSAAQPPLG
jgi:hypothetical protein